jgi:hypothetical protein
MGVSMAIGGCKQVKYTNKRTAPWSVSTLGSLRASVRSSSVDLDLDLAGSD